MATRLTGAKRFAEVVGLLRSPLAKARGLTASLHFFLGLALQEQGAFDEAAREYRECVAKRGRVALTPINPDILGSGLEHCLANCLLRLERKGEALRALPANPALVAQRAEALVRRLQLHLGALGEVLPGAAGVLGEVLAQAGVIKCG